MNKTAEDSSLIPTKGNHTFSICRVTSEKAIKLQNLIEGIRHKREYLLKSSAILTPKKMERLLLDLHDEYTYLIRKLHDAFLLRQYHVNNITCTVGRSVLAQRLAGINTYSGNITHTAIGTGTTAVAIGDTQLTTEVYRKALSSGAFISNVSYIETFFSALETSGNYKEFGNFIDGSASANTGQLVNHFLQTISKSTSETMNVQSIFTISDA